MYNACIGLHPLLTVLGQLLRPPKQPPIYNIKPPPISNLHGKAGSTAQLIGTIPWITLEDGVSRRHTYTQKPE